MGSLMQDLRYGIRILLKNPGFTAIAVLTLALGIGGNATVFSWVQSVLLHPLPAIQHSDRLVAIETIMPSGEYHTSSYPDFRDYRDQNQLLSGLVGCELVPVNMTWAGNKGEQRIWGEIVTENYFDVLGVRAERGRLFTAKDRGALNGDPYIVLSYAFWQRQFGGKPNMIGQTVDINNHSFTIIAIAPRGFQGTIVGVAPDYWVPMMMQPVVLPGEDLEQRSPTFVHLMGVLKPGVTIAQAQADFSTIARQLAREYPNSNRNVSVSVAPVWKAHYGAQSLLLSALLFLSVVALLVLLIACANIANLLLARAAGREREVAIRSALGASRPRLLRQFLVESLLLALAGGVGGILIALWAANLLVFFLPGGYFPIGLPLGIDGEVLAVTAGLSILTGIIFGVVPALHSSSPDVNRSLKEGGRSSSAGRAHGRLRSLLVVSEISLALVLLVAAGLLLRSVRSVQSASPGFNPRHVFLAAFDLRPDGYTNESSHAFYDTLIQRLRALPGVEAVSMERYVPLWFYGRGYTRPGIEGYTPQPGEDMFIDFNDAGPNYFSTMQIPMVAGREFTEQDRQGAPLVVIINQTMAERFWPRQSALGHRVDTWGRAWTIVGVAKDIKYHTMTENPESFLYFPSLENGETAANVLIRSSVNPAGLLGEIRETAKSLNPSVMVLQAANVDELVHISLFSYRTAAVLSATLGGLGLLLATIGIYGVLSYTVSQRTHEIGVRMALGARPVDVVRLVIGQGARLLGIGLIVGVVASLAVTRLMSSLLFSVSAKDPATFVSVAVLLTLVALAACYVPARRAMRLDPTEALRYE
ncbi:MAG TPA: ABC transporter permease [Candidatus Acidoferrales bacterium]|nr:ABC transporter permease [Candidatus Acidoferrales bacterium]